MKKFLLLIVGVLFALSANAENMTWTIYADVSNKNWKEVWLRYGDYKNSANVAKGWVVDPVKNIYKFQFTADKGLSSIAFTNWGTDWGNPSSGWGENIVGDFKSENKTGDYQLANGKLYTFKSGSENGAPATDYTEEPAVYLVGKFGGVDHWTPGTNAYKFEGPWNNLTLDLTTVKGDDDSSLSSITTDDEFAIVCLNDNKWHKNEGKESQKLLNKDELYQTYDDTNINIKVFETINNPVISLNSYNWQITITEKAVTPDPDPTDEYVYKLHTNIFVDGWDTYNMIKQEDGTWVWEGQIRESGKKFGIKQLSSEDEPINKDNIWIAANSADAKLTESGSSVGCKIDGSDITINATGSFKLVFNPKDPNNMTVTLIKLDSELEFTYAVKGTLLGEDWASYTMTKVPGANWWYLEGKFQSGDFGIVKQKNGAQWNGDNSEDTGCKNGWIYSSEGTNKVAIRTGEWQGAVVEGYPVSNPGSNWTLSDEVFKGNTTYTIMFNADPYNAETNPTGMHIFVSNVAASGVEDINVDEDAPVEYFNLQGQRVNGELTPGIYIRRQGSTVTKVRF